MHKWWFSLKLIAITIVFHKSYQCGIMSEITLNITLYGFIDYKDILFHNDSWW